MLQDAVLQLDGFDRFQLRSAGYFRLVQPWQYHTVIPEDFFVYSYSFCLEPESAQPSGSFNASRMDSVTLQLNLASSVVNPPPPPPPPAGSVVPCPKPPTYTGRVYGINHNVFRIADGFGGVLFTI